MEDGREDRIDRVSGRAHEEEPDDHVLDPLQVRDTGKGQLQEDAREAGHGLTTRA